MATMSERFGAMARGEIPPAPVARLGGFRLTSIGSGEAVFELDAWPLVACASSTRMTLRGESAEGR